MSATRWQEHGIALRTVQELLGHKSLEMTQIYLGVQDGDKMRPNVDRAFGDRHMETMRREQETFFSKAGLRHRWPTGGYSF